MGLAYVSINAGCFRILVPDGAPAIDPIGAEYVFVTRGKWVAKESREAMEFVFEDGSDAPYHLIVEMLQCDRLPAGDDDGRTDLRCIGYRSDLSVAWNLPARSRVKLQLPYLKAW